jgi:hypothetical protein
MGNFQNVSMGNGELFWNGVSCGYLKGDVQYRYNYTVEDFKVDVPLQLAGSVTKEVIAELTAPLAEISVANIAMALGGLTPVNTGTPTTVANSSPYQTRTFAAFHGGLEAIVLDGPAVADLEVRSSDGVTQYDVDVDYFLVPGTHGAGFVYRNPTGDIASGATVRVAYKHTQVTGQQINLGVQFSLAEGDLEFRHKSPVNGKFQTVKMWKAVTNGVFELNYSEGNFLVNNVTFKAVRDTSHPTNPLGYWHKES